MAKKNDDEKMILELSETYDFEDRKISQLDFSKYREIKGSVIGDATNVLNRIGHPITNQLSPEIDTNLLIYCAHLSTGEPLEFFFDALSMRDFVITKNRMRQIFFGQV